LYEILVGDVDGLTLDNFLELVADPIIVGISNFDN
jgi:hypothetical protein